MTGDLVLFDENLDTSPGRYRRDDHASSISGARSVALRAGSQKARLLEAYATAAWPLSDEDAAVEAGVPPRSCFWKRCSELRADGLIEVVRDDQGEPVLVWSDATSAWRNVCRITDAGRAVRAGLAE